MKFIKKKKFAAISMSILRINKLNKHIQRTFGEVLQEEAFLSKDVLVTIARVDTVPNLKFADIWLYIQPISEAESVVAELNDQLYELQGALNRKLDLKPFPRVVLKIDYGAEYANKIEQRFKELRQADQEEHPPSRT